MLRVRVVFLVLVILGGLQDSARASDEPADDPGLQGTWKLASIAQEGTVVKASQGPAQVTLVISGINFVMGIDGQEGASQFRVNPAAQPPSLDVRRMVDGKTVKWIYQLENDTLEICSVGEEAPRPTDFSTNPGDGKASMVFKRGESRFRVMTGHSKSIAAVAFSPDGKALASADQDGVIHLWNTNSCRLDRTIARGGKAVLALAFSGDGRTLVAAGEEYAVTLWNLEDGTRRQVCKGVDPPVQFLRLFPDGRRLVLGTDAGKFELWNLEENRLVGSCAVNDRSSHKTAVSPDAKTLAFGTSDSVILHDLIDNREIRKLDVGRVVSDVAFSPDGRLLAASASDIGALMGGRAGEVYLWEPSSGREVSRLMLRSRQLESLIAGRLAFSPDGQTLAVGAAPGPAGGEFLLWDLKQRRLMGRFGGIEGSFDRLVFSPDGRTLATFSLAYVIKLWDLGKALPPADDRAPASTLPPNLTAPVMPRPNREPEAASSPVEEAAALQSLLRQQAAEFEAGQLTEAEATARKILGLAERSFPDEPEVVAGALELLGQTCQAQNRPAEAERFYRRAMGVLEEGRGPEDAGLTTLLASLARLCQMRGNAAEAERLYRRAVPLAEKNLGPDDPVLAANLSNLGLLCAAQAKYDEAETLYRRAIAIGERAEKPGECELHSALNNLALLYVDRGRYLEAEPLFRRAIEIREKASGPDDPQLAQFLNNLGMLYGNQYRLAEAESIYRRAIEVLEKARGAGHPDVLAVRHNLANAYLQAKRFAEAEPLYQQVLSGWEEVAGRSHPFLCKPLNGLAILYWRQSRYDEAELLYRRALTIGENALGPDHPEVAGFLHNLAVVYKDQRRNELAEETEDRAIAIFERAGASPLELFGPYHVLAQIYWNQQRHAPAVAALRRAMDAAEQQRGRAAGGERERATYFSEFLVVFERMVNWQTDLENPAEAFNAMERSRAQSLLDQMAIGSIDLLSGVEPAQAAALRQREAKALARLADVERQGRELEAKPDLSPQDRKQGIELLRSMTRQAREDYASVYAEIRNASPAYRLAIGEDRKPLSLESLQEWAAARDALVLEYLLGADGGYVLVIPGKEEARLSRLRIDGKDQVAALGGEPGPLTAERLAQVLANEEDTGLLQRLRKAETAADLQQVTPGLNSLFEVLVPKAQREAILAEKFKRLVILPDAALAQLPFETLVVEKGEKPRYFLDVGPSVQYAPSATILVNLAERAAADSPANREPVLTIGDPAYGGHSVAEPAGVGRTTTPRSCYGHLRGSLEPLPFTAWETDWVRSVFGENGVTAAQLKGDQATEASVRSLATGRRVLHLACHGLVDQSQGNLFGALALTPGSNSEEPSDDGFLTLAEVYAMSLQGSEVTILSACDTNVGPQQRGEGVWAISRGFLVAGSRRVVASSWLVDDESAASLVSYFCSLIARAEKAGQKPDYAEALREAKRWVRAQEKWSSPYFWGNFVLVGPN